MNPPVALLRPGDVHRLLERHGLAPSRRLGQHFVVDQNTVRKVVRDAGVRPGERVCEIGAGLGSLTLALREAGAQVIAIEIDAGLVKALREVVGSDPGVRVVHADVRTSDLSDLVPAPAVLVANLPYNIATAVTLDALAAGIFARGLVMVQREVGRRWVAGVGDPEYGAVSVKIAAYARARIAATVSRRAFYPVPQVDSITVRLHPRAWTAAVDRGTVLALVERGFAQRRKRLRNALAFGVSRTTTEPGSGADAPQVEAALVAAGIDPGVRAEQLDLPAWCRLAGAFQERGFAA